MHEDTHIGKRIRHTETCLDIGSEKDILRNSHDDLSLHCPDSIVNRLLMHSLNWMLSLREMK